MARAREKIQNILRGMGSFVDICPAADYRRFVPRKAGPERMRGHFVPGPAIKFATCRGLPHIDHHCHDT
jgi:hypothetical protein